MLRFGLLWEWREEAVMLDARCQGVEMYDIIGCLWCFDDPEKMTCNEKFSSRVMFVVAFGMTYVRHNE